ncbi:GTPase Era, mitochondrial [Geodia barretti]|uniref:GTPase Era, mitochondrial n=2 Tax=Geodia barretti TaxID=519541 RepID=A0AA35WEM8_GEOBA|nr:GTPase Era, mitochondrial [Geodia barretti]
MVLSVCVRVVCRHIKESRSVSAALSRYCTSLVTESVVAAPDCTETEPRRQTTDRQRLLRAAVLGVPNAGKTTLVNQLLGRKLFAVSPKRHTTTRNVVGVFTEGDHQVILMDTPGVVPYQVGRKLRAPKSFLTGPHRSLMEAEFVVVVVDASDKRQRHQLDVEVLKTLARYSHVPAILLLNKVDAIRHKHVLLEITESILESTHSWMVEEGRRREQRMKMSPELRNESGAKADVYCGPTREQGALPAAAVESFGKVFMSSALTGDGVQDLRVMQWSKSTNSLFSPEIKFIVNGGWD